MTPLISSRRTFLLATLAVAAAAGLPASPALAASSPADPIAAIYKRVTAGKGTEGGQFVWADAKARQRYMSASLARLWAAALARVKPGDMGPPGFDPVSNSQDPLVRAFAVKVEKADGARATVAVTFGMKPGALAGQPTQVVRYDMVRDGGRGRGAWKIDDIRGSVEGDPWSIRGILTGFKG